jgi:hypothetical protein
MPLANSVEPWQIQHADTEVSSVVMSPKNYFAICHTSGKVFLLPLLILCSTRSQVFMIYNEFIHLQLLECPGP